MSTKSGEHHQLLYEIRAKASDTTSAANVESDAPSGNGLASAPNQFGRVGYMHAGGIDRPLGVVRISGNSLLLTFYPHVNWRGLFEGASGTDTLLIDNEITWPGEAASAFLGAPASGPDEWMGSLVREQSDASGLLYRRNRYYDPTAGQFTQADPIGIAGGLNQFVYAGGDPLNNYDPTGKVCEKKSDEELLCTELTPNDRETIKTFLGGAAGESAFEFLTDIGLGRWDEGGCPGGFGATQCDRLGIVLSNLINHADPACSEMGTRASRMHGKGRVRLSRAVDFFGKHGITPSIREYGFIFLAPSAFAFDDSYIQLLVGHEVWHTQNTSMTGVDMVADILSWIGIDGGMKAQTEEFFHTFGMRCAAN